MRRAITTLALLLGAVLMAIAWLWREAPEAPPDGDGGGTAAEAPPGDPHENAAGAAGDPTEGAAAAPSGAASAPGPTSGEQDPQRPPGPRVWIEVQVRAELFAPPAPDVEVTRSGKPVPAEAEVVAGCGDGWPLDPNGTTDGPAFVRVHLAGTVVHRRVSRSGGAPVRVEIGPDRALRGRVVDAAARPVEGANVWYGGADDQVAATDADGRFAVDVPAGKGVPVVARAPGKAWKCAFADVHLHHGGDVALTLADEAVLTVQVTGEELPLRGSFVALVPGDAPKTELQAFPFFLAPPLPIDAEGRATLRGLPAGATVGVAVFGPAVPRTPVREVALRAGMPAVEVQVAAAAAVRGRAVDGRGEPLPDVEIWSWSESRAPRDRSGAEWLLSAGVPNAGVAVARSDAAGEFAVTLPAGSLSAGAKTALAARRPGGVHCRAVLSPPVRALELVLPHSVAAGTLTVPPPEPGVAWSIRVDPWTEGFVAVAADTPFVRELPAAVVAEVRVRREGEAGAWSPVRTKVLVLDAATAVPAELLRR